MRKIWFSLISFILIFSTSAEEFVDGQQYITLDRAVSGDEPQVTEFFSFFCSPCYQFEEIYHVSDDIKKMLPPSVKIVKYHVDFLGRDLGPILTHAWAVAIALGVEDLVSGPIFDRIQKTKSIIDITSLKDIFVKSANIKSEDYDAVWNSFTVKTVVIQQQKAAMNANLHGVPAVIINGKYMVNNRGLDTSSIDNFIQQYTSVIKFLLKKSKFL